MNINDTFNRADQTNLGTSSDGTWAWSTDNLELVGGSTNSMSLVSNKARQNTPSGLVSVRAERALTNNDNYAQASIVTKGTGDSLGVNCRESTGTNPSYYIAILLESTNDVALYKNTGGQSFTQLGSNTAVSVSLPQTIRVQAIGTTIKCFYAGVEKISVSDSAVTTGSRTGMRMGAGGSTQRFVDDFRAGDAPEVADAAVDQSFGLVIG